MHDQEPIDTDAQNEQKESVKTAASSAIGKPAKSMDVNISVFRQKKLAFARPSSMKWKTKVSKPNLNNPNRDPNASAQERR